MGNTSSSSSSSASNSNATASATSPTAAAVDSNGSTSSCPVRKFSSNSKTDNNNDNNNNNNNSECPAKYAEVYDVYGQRIDPRNQMPATANQQPWPGQKVPLSVTRVQSNIPKGGTDGTWLYPSPQMFFNAIKRKGKDSNVVEEDVETVVAIHNNMNERTWQEIMKWEALNAATCSNPRLLRFEGRDSDLSPKAYIRTLFGFPKPFDRHDWIVDRCGQKVRYVIDYYIDNHAPSASYSQLPTLTDLKTPSPVWLDARPAIDDFSSFWIRLQMFPSRMLNSLSHRYFSSGKQQQHQQTQLNEKAHILMKMRTVCTPNFHALLACNGDEECKQASTKLNLCLADNCPSCQEQVANFRNVVAAKHSPQQEEAAFQSMADCVKNFGAKK